MAFAPHAVVALALILCPVTAVRANSAGVDPNSRESGDGVLISGESFAVVVNEFGVLTGFPPEGLATIDGRVAELLPGTLEWFGIHVEMAGGDIDAVGTGLAPDWKGRILLEPVSLIHDEQEAIAVMRLGELWIESRFHFDPDGPYLLNTITYTNLGEDHIDEVQATREWSLVSGDSWDWPSKPWKQSPPPGLARMHLEELALAPGASASIGFSYRLASSSTGSASKGLAQLVADVPIAPYTDNVFPTGLDFGATNGISWGDVDGDGWPDVVACQSGHYWRNLAGKGWVLEQDLDQWLPQAMIRYGTSLADFDRNGLADIATEPRIVQGDACLRLLRSDAGGQFTEIGAVPGLVAGLPCNANGETIAWADVDGDQDLDLFFPAYPDWVTAGGVGNRLLENLGPAGPQGETTFQAIGAGLENPFLSAKPEGAQFADVDGDGDLDLYCNATLYRNVSTLGVPAFEDLDPIAWTVLVNTVIDEGVAFLDYDMDGDLDLVVAYIFGAVGTRLFENRGDGTFAYVDQSTIESHLIGLGLGLSVADWDGDGDLDITTRNVFRRNMYVETGVPGFIVATTQIDPTHISSATPAWADWDRDGDLDCALGNYFENGRLYANSTYDATTPAAERRYLRVRPVSAGADGVTAIEDQFGAAARVDVQGEVDRVRRDFTASGHGYLNQNEYALHFALPADPDPLTPLDEQRVDVSVDFISLPELGQPRVDRFVNPVLGELMPSALSDRELTVYRDGRVSVNGALLAPVPSVDPLMLTTTGGLVLPDAQLGLAEPVSTGGDDRWVGLDFDTLQATSSLFALEFLLDGQLASPAACLATPANVVLWDLNAVGGPEPIWSDALTTRSTNRRSVLPMVVELLPKRRYRLLARVTSYRATPITGPVSSGPLRVRGGITLGAEGCNAAAVGGTTADFTRVYAALRFRSGRAEPWVSLGQSSAGGSGVAPVLSGEGLLVGGKPARIRLSKAAPNAPVTLFVGADPVCASVAGHVLVPGFNGAVGGLMTNADGRLTVSVTWPSGFAPGYTTYLQVVVTDPGAPQGAALSNALVATTQE